MKLTKGFSFAYALLGLVALAGIIRAMMDGYPAHFTMYYEEARALWSEQSAYGPQPTHPNLFFYSPTFALFFIGPLTLLPLKVALLIYLVASTALFFFGLFRFVRNFPEMSHRAFFGFCVLIAPHLFHCLPADKLELAIVGAMLLSVSWILERRNWTASATLLALVANWKLQPLPALGLLGLILIFLDRRWKWSLTAAGMFVFWSLLPFLVKPWGYLIQVHRTWLSSLSGYSRECFDFYDNLFSFLKNSLKISMSFETAQKITILCALVFAAAIGNWALRRNQQRGGPKGDKLWREGILLSFTLGMTFTTLLSPLQQVNAYILLLPAFFSACWAAQLGRGKGWIGFSASIFVIFSLSTSDAVPTEIREVIRHASIKSVVSLILAISLLIRAHGIGSDVKFYRKSARI